MKQTSISIEITDTERLDWLFSCIQENHLSDMCGTEKHQHKLVIDTPDGDLSSYIDKQILLDRVEYATRKAAG